MQMMVTMHAFLTLSPVYNCFINLYYFGYVIIFYYMYTLSSCLCSHEFNSSAYYSKWKGYLVQVSCAR